MLDERHLQLNKGTNFRELGGYPTAAGRPLKWCKLLRAGDLAKVTSTDQQTILDHGVTTVIDLRSSAEVQQNPDVLVDGVKWVALPILDDDETESTQTVQSLQQLYSLTPRGGYLRMLNVYCQLVVSNQAQMAYTRFFRYLLAHGQRETILFHCTAGKDRTGIVAALVLAALGVERQVIYEDYLLTNRYSRGRVNRRLAEAQRAAMNDEFLASIRDLSLVSRDYLDRVCDIIDEEYGGMRRYLENQIGLTQDDFQQLRSIYLV